MNGDEDGVEDGGTSGGEESCENGGEIYGDEYVVEVVDGDNDDEVGIFIGGDGKVEWFNSNCFDEQLTDIHRQRFEIVELLSRLKFCHMGSDLCYFYIKYQKKILYVFFYVNFSFQAPLKCIQLLSFVFVWI